MRYSLLYPLILLFACHPVIAQTHPATSPATTWAATTAPITTATTTATAAFPNGPVAEAYHRSLARATQAFQESMEILGQRRVDAIARAKAAFERAVEQADASYRAGVTRSFGALAETRASGAAAATAAYDHDIRAHQAAGDIERAEQASAAKETFLAAFEAEGVSLRESATALPIVTDEDLRPAPPPTVTLRVRARIDGSDECVITREGAVWHHRSWEWPPSVDVNDIKWVPVEQRMLRNAGETRFLPPVDFSRARVVSRSGRGVVACETSPDRLHLFFADADGGSDVHEITIELPARRARD